MTHLLCIPTDLNDHDTDLLLGQAAELGCAGVAVRHRHGDGIDTWDRCRRLGGQVAKHGLSVRAIMLNERHGPFLNDLDASRREEAVRWIASYLSWTAELGASVLIVPTGGVGGSMGHSTWSYQEALNATALSLTDLSCSLERSGVKLAITVAADGFLLSPPEARDLIDRIHAPHLGASLAATPSMPASVAQDWAKTLHRRLFAVDFSEVPCGVSTPSSLSVEVASRRRYSDQTMIIRHPSQENKSP